MLQEVGAEDPEPVFAILIFAMLINFIHFYCLVGIFGTFCREILSERGIGVHEEYNHVK